MTNISVKTAVTERATNVVAQLGLGKYVRNWDNQDQDEGNPYQIVIGGDGTVLDAMRFHMTDANKPVIFGINAGNVGFLTNPADHPLPLPERLVKARLFNVNPIKITVVDVDGVAHTNYGYNEINVARQSEQTAHLRIAVNGRIRIGEFVGDGVLASTPLGSTGYNMSAGGPIVPLGHDLMTLVPLAPYQPKGWSGAVLPGNSLIDIEVLDPRRRPVKIVADSRVVIEKAVSIHIREDKQFWLSLGFDNDYSLEERVIREQFK